MPKLYNTADFIRRARKIHGSKYSYKKTVYRGSNKTVTITCPDHGDFRQVATAHVNRGSECPRCARIKVGKKIWKTRKKNFTTQDFIRRAKLIHGSKYDYSKARYRSAKTLITIVCLIHGPFRLMAGSHIHSRHAGCVKCAYQKASTRYRLSTEEFIRRARKRHGNRYGYKNARYVSAKSKVWITCNQHGDFLQGPAEHVYGRGCPKCGYAARAMKRTKTLLSWSALRRAVKRLKISSIGEYLKLYKQIPGAHSQPATVYKEWTNWSAFLGTSRRQTRIATSGRVCPSVGAAFVESFLFGMGIPFEPEHRYGSFRADWRLKSGELVEYFGFEGESAGKMQTVYRNKIRDKIKFCEKNKFVLIPIYPKDLNTPGRLKQLLAR